MLKKNFNKIQLVREYILNILEAGLIDSRGKLPGARNISDKLNVSFLIVQNAISTLVNEGILYTQSTSGTFVRDNWKDQILTGHIKTNYIHYSWFDAFRQIIKDCSPDFRVVRKFNYGMFEIRPSLDVQINQYEFTDLSEIYKEICMPEEKFYKQAKEQFMIGRKILGIPFVFSPRVMFYNRKIIKDAGLNEPNYDWTWDEFLYYIDRLAQIRPVYEIFSWTNNINVWINVVLKCGGALIDTESPDPIKLDCAQTIKGIKLWKELRDKVLCNNSVNKNTKDYLSLFIEGKKVFFIGSRPNVLFFRERNFDDWGTVPIPIIEKDCNFCTQATEVLCIRKNLQYDNAKRFIQIMTSEKIQNFMSDISFHIPFLKSAAQRSYESCDLREKVFFEQIPNMYAKYFVVYPEFFNIIAKGMDYIWNSDEDIESLIGELADLLRMILKFRIIN